MAISDDVTNEVDTETVVSMTSSLFMDFPDVETAQYHRESASYKNNGLETAVPHMLYYFQDNMVEIKVEDILFRIPRFYLTRHSQYFTSLFEERDANKIKTPLVLKKDKVNATAFANLLQVLDTPRFSTIGLHTVDEWGSVLDLAHRWGFAEVKALAITHLHPITSPVDQIMLGRFYAVHEWLPDAYLAVCERRSSLRIEEARRIPLEDVVTIAGLRDLVHTSPPPSRDVIVAEIARALGLATPAPTTVPLASLEKHFSHNSSQLVEDACTGDQQNGTKLRDSIDSMLCALCNTATESDQAVSVALSFVQRKVQTANMLQDVLRAIVTKGFDTWNKDNTSPSRRCAELCNLMSQTEELNFSSEPGLNTTDVVTFLLARVCSSLVDYTTIHRATYDGLAMRQAGFLALLHQVNMVSGFFIESWCVNILRKCIHLRIIAKDVENIFAFLSSVGSIIVTCTDASGIFMDATKELLKDPDSYETPEDWKASEIKVKALEDMGVYDRTF